QELFDDLGGVTLELLIDNPKAFVIKNNPKSEEEIKYNPHALAMALNLGVELNEYSCAAEPPIRCGVSHVSGQA
ncbi:MAG: hypothetical protein VZR06_06835, partial [Butyrivibrio sp.]|nr:hypothetical protein [Butyrivibrio sp.]